jgi:hypothetical protein
MRILGKSERIFNGAALDPKSKGVPKSQPEKTDTYAVA